jgi:glyoxylase-like metal-dependent hydrolase (beta-lactamase superfamily II)
MTVENPVASAAAAGVHRIELPVGGGGVQSVNVYVLATAAGPVLIDSGWHSDEAERRLEAGLGELGYELGDVTTFLITHVHRDHYEVALRLRKRFGSRVLLGIGERPSLQILIDRPAPEQLPQRRRMCQAGAGALWNEVRGGRRPEVTWELPDAWLRAPQTIEVGERRLKVIATPGHTQGHVVFADAENGLLFSGDHILPRITPSIGFESVPADSALGDFLASLLLIRSMAEMRLLPAHGPVAPTTHGRIDELLAHHDERLTATGRAVADGAHTAADVAVRLPWSRRCSRFEDLDIFNRMLAINETKAHLDLLTRRGGLERRDEDGVHHYLTVTPTADRAHATDGTATDETATTWA